MFSKLFRSILLLALSIAANGAAVQKAPVKLSIARQFNTTGAQHILQHDQARARHLKTRAAAESFASTVNEPVTNQAVIYTASVGVGSPATLCESFLMDDTVPTNAHVSGQIPLSSTQEGGLYAAINVLRLTDQRTSSNTWVGANQAYNPTSTSQETRDTVVSSYQSCNLREEIEKILVCRLWLWIVLR